MYVHGDLSVCACMSVHAWTPEYVCVQTDDSRPVVRAVRGGKLLAAVQCLGEIGPLAMLDVHKNTNLLRL